MPLSSIRQSDCRIIDSQTVFCRGPYPSPMSRSGADLALLLLGGFRTLVDAATAELADRGHEDVRPVHDFAIRAIAAGADSASELGRRLSITKQSAGKPLAVLRERGSAARAPAPRDPRRKRLQVT